jgi:hypothetical protein
MAEKSPNGENWCRCRGLAPEGLDGDRVVPIRSPAQGKPRAGIDFNLKHVLPLPYRKISLVKLLSEKS